MFEFLLSTREVFRWVDQLVWRRDQEAKGELVEEDLSEEALLKELFKAYDETRKTCPVEYGTMEPAFMLTVFAQILKNEGLQDVIKERNQQITKHEYSPEHDDRRIDYELSEAAIVYAGYRTDWKGKPPKRWPFDRSYWKPKTYRENLVRSAALILAEIDRIDRMNKSEEAN